MTIDYPSISNSIAPSTRNDNCLKALLNPRNNNVGICSPGHQTLGNCAPNGALLSQNHSPKTPELLSTTGDDMNVSDCESDIGCADAPTTNAVVYGLGNVVPQRVVGDDVLKQSKDANLPLAPLPSLPSPLPLPIKGISHFAHSRI
ncbi:hypothetical protein AAF712_005238 [Marasmius tenuissimus]|uniref:Uncharacterized protein n=1 Tax=Marasmius tenuissimus TaxID=585030 RepID=A0ABR3A2D1_9AGAR